MRMTAVALILVWLASPDAPAQEAKAKSKPEPAKVQVKRLVEDKDAVIGQLAIEVRAYMLAELRFARAARGLS